LFLQTERSHEENQERAYIAASRRQDRSIEARVQSARMASEIHKKRTGKSFRISEDIVRKEEMYEEEEDDLPRSYRLLHPHMQTESPEFNARIEAWMSNRLAMSKYMQRANDEWNDNHINRLFAQSFPHAGQQAQQMQMSLGSGAGSYNAGAPQSPNTVATQSPLSPTFAHRDRTESISSAMSPTHIDATAANMNTLSPVSLGVHDVSTPTTPLTRQAPSFDDQEQPQSQPQPQSAFTSELPPEMKLMMGLDTSYNQTMYGHQNWSNLGNTNDGFFADMIGGAGQQTGPAGKLDELEQPGELFGDENWQQMVDEPAWDNFLDDNAWSTEQ
jgi:hypothetical protein